MLAFYESTDISHQPQIAIFIRFMFDDGLAREEFITARIL